MALKSLVCSIGLVLVSLCSTGKAAISRPAEQLLFYCHLPLTAAAPALFQSESVGLLGAPPLTNPATNATFGSARVFDHKCTLTPSSNAAQFCRARGAGFVNSRNGTQLIVSTLHFNNVVPAPSAKMIKGVITMAGGSYMSANYTARVPVVGGVGDFFAASGEVDISTFNVTTGGADMVLKFVVKLVYPLYTQ